MPSVGSLGSCKQHGQTPGPTGCGNGIGHPTGECQSALQMLTQGCWAKHLKLHNIDKDLMTL